MLGRQDGRTLIHVAAARAPWCMARSALSRARGMAVLGFGTLPLARRHEGSTAAGSQQHPADTMPAPIRPADTGPHLLFQV